MNSFLTIVCRYECQSVQFVQKCMLRVFALGQHVSVNVLYACYIFKGNVAIVPNLMDVCMQGQGVNVLYNDAPKVKRSSGCSVTLIKPNVN